MAQDNFTEVTNESWLGRIGDSIKGILIGIVLLVIAVALLFWNEGRAVDRARTLALGGKSVVSVSADAVDPANEGKLVHLSGEAKTTVALSDSEFGITATAITLKRNVEMYQWKEEEHSETHDKLGGGKETVKTYTYEKTWSPDQINSQRFKNTTGHENPGTMPVQKQTFTADPVTVGAFTLSKNLVSKINSYEPLPVAEGAKTPAGVTKPVKIADGIYYYGANPGQPEIGDTKVSFQVINPCTVSVVAGQSGKMLQRYQVQGHGTIELLQVGEADAVSMFHSAEKENSTLAWVLRAVGFVLMFIGLILIAHPLVVVVDAIPIVGNLFGAGVTFFAFMISVALSLLTISIAWVVYRPLIGVPLLVVAIAAIVFVHETGRKRKMAKG